MINRMNLGTIHFALAFGIMFALTRDPWISGLVSLIAPMIHAVAVLAHSAPWRRLFQQTAERQNSAGHSDTLQCRFCTRSQESGDRHPHMHA